MSIMLVRRVWVKVAVVAIALIGSIVAIILAAHYHATYSSPPNAYAVAVDAGSTHTDVRNECIVCA